MSLSPGERRKIYEEEKARIDEEERQRRVGSQPPTTGLKPNVAGLLCYLGGWVTGIIFLIIEQKDRFVRFHAAQSIVIFGFLSVAAALLSWIPVVGAFFGAVIGVAGFVLWIVLMVKAYQGELYRLPVAGDVAAGVLEANWFKSQAQAGQEPSPQPGETPHQAPAGAETSYQPGIAPSKKGEDIGRRVEAYFQGSYAGRVVGYSFAIFFNVAALIFFSFFHKYIAWYHTAANGVVTRLPLLNGDYFMWLPILITGIIITIGGNIIMIIFDHYWVRSIVQMVIDLVSIVVIANLVAIFPFNFGVIPNSGLSEGLQVGLPIFLIVVAVLLGIAILVRFVKFIVYVSSRNPA
jgi:uncharacterized membrane protein